MLGPATAATAFSPVLGPATRLAPMQTDQPANHSLAHARLLLRAPRHGAGDCLRDVGRISLAGARASALRLSASRPRNYRRDGMPRCASASATLKQPANAGLSTAVTRE